MKLKDAQIVDKALFLGVFARVFGEEISIWIRDWVRKITLSNVGGTTRSTEGLNRTKRQKRANSPSQLELAHLPSALRHQSSWFWKFRPRLALAPEAPLSAFSGLWTQTELYHQLAGLQLVCGIRWDFSVSITTWANTHNKSPFIYTYMCVCACTRAREHTHAHLRSRTHTP